MRKTWYAEVEDWKERMMRRGDEEHRELRTEARIRVMQTTTTKSTNRYSAARTAVVAVLTVEDAVEV